MSSGMDMEILGPNELEELYTWIDAAPLTRAKKNIARDFSDGVCVAEIVQNYMPRMIEIHNYVNANSAGQKRINWNMLNRKVFAKLNMKLSDKLIENVIEAKPGAIEQILWDLRRKLTELNPKFQTWNPTPTNGAPGSQMKVRGASFSGYNDLVKKPTGNSSSPGGSHQSRIPTKSNLNGNGTKSALLPTPSRRSPARSKSDKGSSEGGSYTAGLKDEVNHYASTVAGTVNSPTIRAEPDSSSGANTGFFPGVVDSNANGDPSLPPSQVIFKGHKMVPSLLLEMKNKQIRDLELIIGHLEKKVTFQDNLIQLKDNRLQDVTQQNHTLRSKFQELTQTKLPDYM